MPSGRLPDAPAAAMRRAPRPPALGSLSERERERRPSRRTDMGTRWSGGALAIVAAGLLAACSSPGPSLDGAPSRTPTAAARTHSEGSVSGGGGTRVAGVSLKTDRAVYPRGEVIHAVIRNDGTRDVYAASGQTFCTIVTAERSSGGGWRPVAPCPQGAPPGFVLITAGASLSLDLPPPGFPSERLPAGIYRLRCAFAVGAPDGPSARARSPVFTIRI
jgi:hypothetical protein